MTKLTFTGDIGFDKYMAKKWEDEKLLSEDILKIFEESDHVVANIEGALVDESTAFVNVAEMSLLHSVNPAAVSVFRKMKADIWNLCNNHIMDAGPEGVASTLKEAEKFGAMTIGAGMDIDQASKPLYLDEAGGIGMFSVGYRRGCKPAGENQAGCLNWNEMEKIESIIKEIKSRCRWCVVVSHGGEEFTSLPSPYTRDRYLKYLEMGADMVVCHHPHVPMNYEMVGEKAIFYSLGNFIFDTDYQRAQFNTEIGILLSITFTEDAFSFEANGIKIDRESERISLGELPRIFEDVQEEEYEKLKAFAAKMFIAATKRQQLFMFPDKHKDFTEEQWAESFMAEVRSGRVVGEALDFQIIYPLSLQAENGLWKESKLEKVKEYILEQM